MNSLNEQILPLVDGGVRPRPSHRQPISDMHACAVVDRCTCREQEAAGSRKSAADIIFAHSPEIVQRSIAQQDKQAAHRAKLDAAIAESVANQQLSLPFWPAKFRALPNEVFRSALFNARNKSRKREYLKEREIYVIGDGRITYTGEELRQDDETVWLQLIQLAKCQPLGENVRFTARSFLLAIGWPVKSQSYTRLRDCLTRMQATSLQVIVKRLDDSNEKGEEDGKAMSMIPAFEWRDPRTGAPLKQYRVQLASQLVDLYGGKGYFTRVEWAQRLDLPPGLATWLHGYFASHEVPFPIKLGTIKAGAGLTTTTQKHLRELAKAALNELKRVRFLKDWSLSPDDLVKVERLHDL
ncbi:replication initiator protein A [Paraburkholderia sp. LEh10]|uniref:plasmid replication initiator TrfA n=1 Tax=Paraburkholderia sp. LEh10 TaxID=2821353 RepID=UPI001AE3012E|nr:plasmid replication initiator TrfA [Paraburkholderia sp. LEh10]MBP0588700.1 replication initiator protein A [Paraburkholderia sp. LEh10]